MVGIGWHTGVESRLDQESEILFGEGELTPHAIILDDEILDDVGEAADEENQILILIIPYVIADHIGEKQMAYLMVDEALVTPRDAFFILNGGSLIGEIGTETENAAREGQTDVDDEDVRPMGRPGEGVGRRGKRPFDVKAWDHHGNTDAEKLTAQKLKDVSTKAIGIDSHGHHLIS